MVGFWRYGSRGRSRPINIQLISRTGLVDAGLRRGIQSVIEPPM